MVVAVVVGVGDTSMMLAGSSEMVVVIIAVMKVAMLSK